MPRLGNGEVSVTSVMFVAIAAKVRRDVTSS